MYISKYALHIPDNKAKSTVSNVYINVCTIRNVVITFYVYHLNGISHVSLFCDKKSLTFCISCT